MALCPLVAVALLTAPILAQVCDPQGFQFDPSKPVYEQNGKTKSSTPGLDWLSRFQLPVPESAYDSASVAYYTAEQNNLNQFLWDVDWWKYYLECLSDQEIYTELDLGYCNTTYYDNNTCQGNQWVGVPLWVEQDLNAVAEMYYWRLLTLVQDWGGYVFGYDNATFANWGTWFMQQANASKPRSVQKELDKQRQNVSDMATAAYYGIIGNYLGVGFPVECRAQIANTLAGADDFEQAGWQAATTLMALIPVLLTFGNLFVARSSEAFGTSFIVGTMSAVFSLGLPVKSISGIREKQRVTLSHFEFYARQTIATFGKPLKRSHATGDHRSAAYPVRLADMQKWSIEPPKDTANLVLSEEQEASDCSFGDIRRRVLKWRRRAHMWHLSSLLVAITQGVLFLFAIGPLFVGFGTPLLIFDCHNYWTSLWLVVSAGISALFRLAMWETGAHERVKIFALSSRSIWSLQRLIHDSRAYTLGSEEGYLLNTTETQLPPLHPALLTSIGHSLYKRWGSLMTRFFPQALSVAHHRSNRDESLDSDYEGVTQSQDSLFEKPAPVSSRSRLWLALRLLRTMVWTAARSPLRFLSRGMSKKPKDTAPMRYRPLMILMHLSTEGRNPLMTLFTGAVEGLILIVLTVFFGAAWGGNLLVLCYVMAVLLVTVTAGRALGLWYVVRSARLFGLHVIETQSPRQILGCLRILCSMKEVLVFVNDAFYFEGHRLDEREGWAEWKTAYERGDFDEDIPGVSMSNSTQRDPSTVSAEPPILSVGSRHDDGGTGLVSPLGSIRLPRRSTDKVPDEEVGMTTLFTPEAESLVTLRSSTPHTTDSTSKRPPFHYQRTADSSVPLVEQRPPSRRATDTT